MDRARATINLFHSMEDRTVIRAEQVRFQYKKRDVDGNVIATEEILKGVDLRSKKSEKNEYG